MEATMKRKVNFSYKVEQQFEHGASTFSSYSLYVGWISPLLRIMLVRLFLVGVITIFLLIQRIRNQKMMHCLGEYWMLKLTPFPFAYHSARRSVNTVCFIQFYSHIIPQHLLFQIFNNSYTFIFEFNCQFLNVQIV